MVVTGHGSSDGIQYAVPGTENLGGEISPHVFYEALKTIKNIKLLIPVFGQCAAGIFNFIEANGSPVICPMGATDLHSSLNAAVPDVGFSNVFLSYFHQWFWAPKDVNGDGKISLLDCYFFAGAKTHQVWVPTLRNKQVNICSRNPIAQESSAAKTSIDQVVGRAKTTIEK